MPEEERLVGFHGTVDEIDRSANQFVVDVFHAEFGVGIHIRVRRQRTAIGDGLLADLAPAGVSRRIVHVGRLGFHDIARAEAGEEFGALRIIGLIRLFHRVEVVENAVEFVEAMHGGQEFVAVAEMVLADLRRRVAEWLEQFGDGRILVLQALLGAGMPTFSRPVRNGVWPVIKAARPAVQDCWA